MLCCQLPFFPKSAEPQCAEFHSCHLSNSVRFGRTLKYKLFPLNLSDIGACDRLCKGFTVFQLKQESMAGRMTITPNHDA